jgi:hypothetical protein
MGDDGKQRGYRSESVQEQRARIHRERVKWLASLSKAHKRK